MTEYNGGELKFKERKRRVFLGLPFSFTVFRIYEEKINIKRGFFKTVEDDCYMYKVQDVKLTRTLAEKMVGLGTVVCYTGDITSPELKLTHVKHSKDIKEYLLKASEDSRRKRRTLHTMGIDAGDFEDTEVDDD